MTEFQEPLEKGWLRTVLNEVRQEVNRWAAATPQHSTEKAQSEVADRRSNARATSK